MRPPDKPLSFAGPRLAGRRFAVVCFGFEASRLRRQPWHVAHGLASGLHAAGAAVTLVTDAKLPPDDTPYAIARLPALTAKGLTKERASDGLAALVGDLAPARVFLVAGLRGLARAAPLPWPVPTSLVLASPRLRLDEILRLGPLALWRERGVLALPLLNALIPDAALRRGFRHSGADDIVYLSRATRRRLTAAGLPPGRLLRPQVVPFTAEARGAEGDGAAGPVIAYLGPPLATRGAFLALKAFETAVARGLRARLLLLSRPDAGGRATRRLLARVAASPARALIEVETAMLSQEALNARLERARVFLLPFMAPVSEAPLVILEAGLSGRPVVTLDAVGVAEFAADLGGVVARRPADLPDALICALHRPPVAAPMPKEGWTSWRRAAADLAAPPEGVLRPYRFVALCGADGSGKTTLIERLSTGFAKEGIATRHVWSRFRNYLSKPLLGLARLTGHNRKEVVNGVRIGYHDFAGHPWLVWPFLTLQLIDNLIDLRLRYRGPTPILADRCVLDTVVDLAVDTGLDDFLIEDVAPRLARRLPRPAFVCVIERHPTRIGQDRPDALQDRNFARRQALFRRLAERLDLPVIDNNGPIEATLCAVLAHLKKPQGTDRDGGDEEPNGSVWHDEPHEMADQNARLM